MSKKFQNRYLVFLLLVLLPSVIFAQNARTVTGKVTDNSGASLPGTNIVVHGTTNGVQADINGNFQITVDNPSNAVLEFSFIGYIPKSVVVDGQTNLNVVLEEEAVGLNEVVVIGYGTVKKKDLTGSVSAIKSAEITKTATNNALQSMQGKIAGLDVTRESGESGGKVNISLRGNRSVNASNSPLFLVDGIEYGSTLDINSSDIASIEVLKDASSTAIYGTRGANGVVIITTRRGLTQTGPSKSKITINSYLSFNSPTNLPKLMSVEQDYRLLAERQRYAAERPTSAWGTTDLANYPADVVLSQVVSAPFEKSVYQIYQEGGVNWFDMIMQNSITENHEISLTGGDAKTSFMISLGYMDDNGLLRNDALNRYNARINLDHKISSKLATGINLQYTYRDWDRRQDNVYTQLIKMHALSQPYLADGNILDKPTEMSISHTNPLLNEVPGYYDNNTQDSRLFGNIFLDWELIKGLHLKSVFGLDQQAIRSGEYADYMCTGNYQIGRGSSFTGLNSQEIDYTWENTLNYTFNLAGVNDFQLLAGQSAQQNIFESHGTSGFGLQDHYGKNSFYDLSSIPLGGRASQNTYTKQNMLSYFGRVNYKLLNKYLLTATFRADGSSVLAEGNKWGYFPSIAGAWVISEESFLKSVQAIDNLKMRLSWGRTGNAAVNPYQTRTVLGTDKILYTFSTATTTSLISGQVPAILGNSALTWETTSAYDGGFDISLLKGRISATVDYYYSRTFDLLLYKGLPASSVYPQVLANVGKTENRGFEAALNLRILESKDFSWTSDITYSRNRDKILSLASGESQDVSNPNQALVVGQPVFSFHGYEADGCWGIDEAATALTFNRVPGDIKIVDRTPDGVINDLDKRLYNQSPQFIFGWNNTITYKGISLSAMAHARVGQWIQYNYNTAYKPTEADGSPAVDFWTPENQGARFPRPGIASQNDIPALAFEKASFFKIRELTLGYTLPKSLSEKIFISNLHIYGSLQNYFTFSNLDNYDPERGGSITNPLSKQMVFGINLEF